MVESNYTKIIEEVSNLFEEMLNKAKNIRIDKDTLWILRCEISTFFMIAYDIAMSKYGDDIRETVFRRLLKCAVKNIQQQKKPLFSRYKKNAADYVVDRYNDYVSLFMNADIQVGQFAYFILPDDFLQEIVENVMGRTILAFGDFTYFGMKFKKFIGINEIRSALIVGMAEKVMDSWYPKFVFEVLNAYVGDIEV